MQNATTALLQKAFMGSKDSTSSITAHHVPLTFAQAGETVEIAKLRVERELLHHLGNLGFVKGAQLTVTSKVYNDMIVEIKGSQVAINGQVANRILTTASTLV